MTPGYTLAQGKRIVYMALREIPRWPGNAKDHDIGGLHGSIDEFDFRGALEFDRTTGRLVSGHGRIETLEQRRDEGQEPPPGCFWSDVLGDQYTGPRDYLVPVIDEDGFATEGKARKYVIAANQHTINGGWHTDLLVAELEALVAEGESLDGVGLDGDDLDRLKADLEGALGDEDDEDGESPPPPPDDRPDELHDSEQGVRYDMGPHRIVFGPGSASDYEALLGGSLANLYERDAAPFAMLLVNRSGSPLGADGCGKALVACEKAGVAVYFLVADGGTCDAVREAWINFNTARQTAGV